MGRRGRNHPGKQGLGPWGIGPPRKIIKFSFKNPFPLRRVYDRPLLEIHHPTFFPLSLVITGKRTHAPTINEKRLSVEFYPKDNYGDLMRIRKMAFMPIPRGVALTASPQNKDVQGPPPRLFYARNP